MRVRWGGTCTHWHCCQTSCAWEAGTRLRTGRSLGPSLRRGNHPRRRWTYMMVNFWNEDDDRGPAYLESILEADFGSDSVRVLSWEAAASGLVLWAPALRLGKREKQVSIWRPRAQCGKMVNNQDDPFFEGGRGGEGAQHIYDYLVGGTGGVASGCIGFAFVVFLHWCSSWLCCLVIGNKVSKKGCFCSLL